jgi:hypothetical protein
MNATLKKISPAIVGNILALTLGLAISYGIDTWMESKYLQYMKIARLRVAVITFDRDRARGELADSRHRHQIACKSIERFAEELAYIDAINEELQRQVDRCPYHVSYPQAASEQ